ncbi:hypothetical protein LUZ60_014816 [Juncus effusus]|nr:hypothetical protein LUZ60_014816 [Juncus effusus]
MEILARFRLRFSPTTLIFWSEKREQRSTCLFSNLIQLPNSESPFFSPDMNWATDSDDSVDWSCFSDNEEKKPEPQITAYAPSSNGVRDNGASSSNSSLASHFLNMGFSEKKVAKAIRENGEGDTDAILDLLLTYQALDEDKPDNENVKRENDDDDEDSDWFNDNEDVKDDFDDWDFEMEMSGLAGPDRKIRTLLELGYSRAQASLAIDRCGDDAPIDELADFITADETQNGFQDYYDSEDEKRRRNQEKYDPFKNKRAKNGTGSNNHNRERLKRAYRAPRPSRPRRQPGDTELDEDLATHLPKPMVGFGLPGDPTRREFRSLPERVMGPPYFFYENVALAPRGVWTTISRHLYDVEPEFVDSKYFSAAARKRGYIHNLPIVNRFPLMPIPPKTIQQAFPPSSRWWPAWDNRQQFNCLQTCIGSAKLTERLRQALDSSDDPPPPSVQSKVMYECKKWNLMWVGQNRLAPLEPDEVEFLLGFPPNHTRGGGASRTERYKSLGNSFQVDTVAYLLSPLKELFPRGMNVLSLFTGIGGAEVALHKLGIKMNLVISVEISPVNRNILRGWWDETRQTGKLIEMEDVQKVNDGHLRGFIEKYGGFDLVIGGSPCNNLAGSNRHHRDGLEGEHSSMFFDYVRILDSVRSMMGRN